MLKVDSRFGLEKVATRSRGPVPRLATTAHDTLGLPEPASQTFGTADMDYDTKALVWVKKPLPPISGPRAPAVTPVPARGAGTRYEVKARGQRFWFVTAHTTEEAWDEVERLCQASGYDARDVVLELHKPVRVAGPGRSPCAGAIVSAAEIRKRLLGSRA